MAKPAAAGADRTDLYAEVTERIVAEMEQGRLPWVQPWDASGAAPDVPRNALSGRRYSGINILLLWTAWGQQRYRSHRWLTFKQATDAGGSVRKGEKGTTVFFADKFVPAAEKARAAQSGDDARAVPFLKRFTLFNVEQIDGLSAGFTFAGDPLPERQLVAAAEELIEASGVDFRIGGKEAFYVPGDDYVQVPAQPFFYEQINYYRTALHELTHATGHASRVGRDLDLAFGSVGYAREELIAEMGSAFLCAALGIEPTVRHADYLASWLSILLEDTRAIFRAASAASKAADWLLARYEVAAERRIAA